MEGNEQATASRDVTGPYTPPGMAASSLVITSWAPTQKALSESAPATLLVAFDMVPGLLACTPGPNPMLVCSFLLIQAAMAGVSELGRRNAEADVRAQADACSVADVDLLREVYSTLGSRWGPFAASGRTDGSCHGPEVGTNDPADEGTWVVAQMTDDGWALVQSSPELLAFDRETDQVHVSIARFETPPPVEPDDPEVLVFYDFWVEP